MARYRTGTFVGSRDHHGLDWTGKTADSCSIDSDGGSLSSAQTGAAWWDINGIRYSPPNSNLMLQCPEWTILYAHCCMHRMPCAYCMYTSYIPDPLNVYLLSCILLTAKGPPLHTQNNRMMKSLITASVLESIQPTKILHYITKSGKIWQQLVVVMRYIKVAHHYEVLHLFVIQSWDCPTLATQNHSHVMIIPTYHTWCVILTSEYIWNISRYETIMNDFSYSWVDAMDLCTLCPDMSMILHLAMLIEYVQ